MEQNQLLGEFEHTIEDALAVSLRRIMAQNGKPVRREYVDKSLYEVHVRQWDDAKKNLAAYNVRQWDDAKKILAAYNARCEPR